MRTSGLESSATGGSGGGLLSSKTHLRSGENDREGSEGVSTISRISSGGIRYVLRQRSRISGCLTR